MNIDPAQAKDTNALQSTPADSPQKVQVATKVTASHGVKEAEPIKTEESIKNLSSEAEISPEVKKAGIQVLKDTIELPPDLKKLGVTPSGPSTPVTTTVTLPQIVLPISDDQVMVGLHLKVASALRWLATWCVKKLKKAHVALKAIHGKIVRVKT